MCVDRESLKLLISTCSTVESLAYPFDSFQGRLIATLLQHLRDSRYTIVDSLAHLIYSFQPRLQHVLLGSFTVNPVQCYFLQFTLTDPQLPDPYQHNKDGAQNSHSHILDSVGKAKLNIRAKELIN